MAFFMGCPIDVSSQRQKIIALSSTESEFVRAVDCAKSLRAIKRIIGGFGRSLPVTTPMLEDNRASIYLSQRTNLNGPRTRHMDVRFHWLQDEVKQVKLVCSYCCPGGGYPEQACEP